MEQLLVLTYGDKIYKCTLHPNEQSIVSIGKEWTNDITNPSLEQEIELKWNNEVNAWMVQDQLIEFNKEIESGKTRDVSLKIFISIVGTTKVFDIGTKHSLTVSQNDYDDISITFIDHSHFDYSAMLYKYMLQRQFYFTLSQYI